MMAADVPALEREYGDCLKSYALLYAEMHIALHEADQEEDDLVSFTAAYQAAAEKLRDLRKKVLDRSDIPDIEMYIRSDCTFNYYAWLKMRAILKTAGGALPDGKVRPMEELVYCGALIQERLDQEKR